MTSKVTDDIIVKYIAGEAEQHEVLMVEEWVKESESNAKLFNHYKTLWNSSAAAKNEIQVDTDAAWEKVSAKIHNKTEAKGRVVRMNTRWLAAASVALLVGLTIFVFNTRSAEQPLLTSTAGAEMQQLKLSDGSLISVQNGSISYPANFDKNHRKVILNKGKVFFDVASDKSRPFEITAGATTITVLGTEFEVNTDSINTRLLVKEGKVRFNTPKGELVLTAGMGAIYSHKDNTLRPENLKNNNVFAYTTGELKFNNQPLSDVVEDLNRYYGKEIIKLDSEGLGNCRITTQFNLKHEKQEDVIAILSTTLGLEASKDANQIFIIKGKGCR